MRGRGHNEVPTRLEIAETLEGDNIKLEVQQAWSLAVLRVATNFCPMLQRKALMRRQMCLPLVIDLLSLINTIYIQTSFLMQGRIDIGTLCLIEQQYWDVYIPFAYLEDALMLCLDSQDFVLVFPRHSKLPTMIVA